MIQYAIPGCPGGVLDLHIPLALPERTTPLWLPRALTEEMNIDIALPESLEVIKLPAPLELSHNVGKLLRGAWVEKGVLHIKCLLSLAQCISPEDYPAFRKMMVEWKAHDARSIVLAPKKQE
jgi:hypothetical protein